MKKIILFLLLSVLFLNMSTVKAFDQIYMFGDSLSDEGYQNNNNTLHKTPLWTSPNGHTWIYDLASKLSIQGQGCAEGVPLCANNQDPLSTSAPHYVIGSLAGTDYAAGGATSGAAGYGTNPHYNPPSLIQQVCQYTTGSKQTYSQCTARITTSADPNALYVIFIGANDVFTSVAAASNCSGLNDTLANQIVNNVVLAITQLQSASSVPLHIVVAGLPDIATTPIGRYVLPLEGCQSLKMAQFIAQLNLLEKVTVSSISTSQVLYIDTFAMMDSLQENYPFANASMQACPDITDSALSCIPVKPDSNNYMFEDGVHPTALTHTLFAAQFYANLQAAGWVA